MPEQIQCHCTACDQQPDPKYPEFGGTVEGEWWCEWCLSCGCHDGQGNGLPNCDMDRFAPGLAWLPNKGKVDPQ